MADTYSQIYIHIVFSVKSRKKIIQDGFKEELHKYITGIIQNKGQKLLQVNTMPDHIHILVGLKPEMAISKLVKEIKQNSTNYINKKRWIKGKFDWQDGFGAYSYAKSQISAVANYIKNQEKHHKVKTFEEEYIEILEKFDIDYEEKYLFG